MPERIRIPHMVSLALGGSMLCFTASLAAIGLGSINAGEGNIISSPVLRDGFTLTDSTHHVLSPENFKNIRGMTVSITSLNSEYGEYTLRLFCFNFFSNEGYPGILETGIEWPEGVSSSVLGTHIPLSQSSLRQFMDTLISVKKQKQHC